MGSFVVASFVQGAFMYTGWWNLHFLALQILAVLQFSAVLVMV